LAGGTALPTASDEESWQRLVIDHPVSRVLPDSTFYSSESSLVGLKTTEYTFTCPIGVRSTLPLRIVGSKAQFQHDHTSVASTSSVD